MRRRRCGTKPSKAALRACLKTTRGAAAGDFGCGQGGEVGASPQRAVTTEPTRATGKRPAARRVFAGKAVWLCCSSVEDPPGIFSGARAEALAPCHPAILLKTSRRVVFKQALKPRPPDESPQGFGSQVAHHGLGPRADMELEKDVLQMAANRVDAEFQFIGDEFVRVPLGKQQ